MVDPLSPIRKLGHLAVDRIWRLGFAVRFMFAVLRYSGASFRRLPLTLREIYFSGVLSLLIIMVSVVLIVTRIIDPTFENLVVLLSATGLALGFAFKDYISSLLAGVVTLYELPYRPGDWIAVNGAYGKVRSIGTRAAP